MGIAYSPRHKGNIYTAENLKVSSGLEQDQLGSMGPGRFVFATKLCTNQRLSLGCLSSGIFKPTFTCSKASLLETKKA